MRTKPLAIGLLGGLFAVLVSASPAFAVTTMVSQENGNWTGDWMEYNRANGDTSLTSAYGAPTGFGTSALKLVTTTDTSSTGDSKTGLSQLSYAGTQLDDLTAISYYTYRDAASTAPEKRQVPALNIEVDVNGAAEGGFTTLVFEPVYNENQHAVAEGVWQDWDAGDASKWWSTSPIPGAPNRDTFVTLAELKAQNPEAVVGKVSVNQGGGNPGLTAAADGLTINDTVYNFEAQAAKPVKATNKEDCKNGGWKDSFQTQYKNQGDCVSSVASDGKAKGNPIDDVVNFFRSLF